MNKITALRSKILVTVLIAVVLLSSLLVFPASATSSWSKPRPSGPGSVTYDETIGNVNSDSEASTEMLSQSVSIAKTTLDMATTIISPSE